MLARADTIKSVLAAHAGRCEQLLAGADPGS
jgi:hypothetical protein